MKEGWEYKKLGEVCTVLNGFAFKSGKYTDSGTRIMRITNVQKGFIVDDDPKYYPSKEMQGLNQYILKENDLLMSLTGNVGRVGLLQKELLPAALNQRVACLRIKDYSLSLRFLFHWLNSAVFEQDAIFSASGIAQKNLSTEWLKSYKIAIPPLSEQQHIVEELDLLSSIIEKKKAQLNELDNLAQSLFYEMFGDPITNEKGWDSNVLENVVASDCSISYGIVQPGDDVFDGIPVVRPVDLISNVVKREGLKRVAKNISDSYRRTILKGGEILLCVRGTTGVMSFASDSLAGCNVTRGITPLSFERRLNRDYVFAYLSSQYIQDIIADNTRGATLKQINMKDVRKLPVQIPPLDLQNQFAEKVQAIEHQKELIKQSIKEVETLFNSRMDYYFN